MNLYNKFEFCKYLFFYEITYNEDEVLINDLKGNNAISLGKNTIGFMLLLLYFLQ